MHRDVFTLLAVASLRALVYDTLTALSETCAFQCCSNYSSSVDSYYQCVANYSCDGLTLDRDHLDTCGRVIGDQATPDCVLVQDPWTASPMCEAGGGNHRHRRMCPGLLPRESETVGLGHLDPDQCCPEQMP